MIGHKKCLKNSRFKMMSKTRRYSHFAYLLVVVLLTSMGCEQSPKKDEDTPLEHQTEISIHDVKKDDVEILLIDGCEYIVYKEADGANRAYGYMSHKGNCNNPIHCRNEVGQN